jgi:tetratricopeptide (TPR) repeat protein
MVKNSIFAVIAALIVCLATPVFAAEELFDTTAAATHLKQGIVLLHAKKYDAAVKEFEEAASINPDAEAYYYLGYTFYLKGRTGDETSRQKSRENFSKAYEIDPNFSPTRLKPTDSQSVTGDRQGKQAGEETLPGQQELQTQPTPSSKT